MFASVLQVVGMVGAVVCTAFVSGWFAAAVFSACVVYVGAALDGR